MKISLVYIYVIGKATPDAPEPSYYDQYHKRFERTYKQFKPEAPHELVVVRCGKNPNPPQIMFGDKFIDNPGQGWDCGTYQRVAPQLDCDIAVFMATPVYFWRHWWLERMLTGWSMHGPGLYGPMASFENTYHLRTSCIMCRPKLLTEFWTRPINTHLECSNFEQSFSALVIAGGTTCKLVTWDGFYDHKDWRKPPNVFRRGDQTNCVMWDRHVDIYRNADKDQRERLEMAADGML